MALKYTRVKDKDTGHQYDVLSHKVDPEAHEPLNDERWPDVSRPRPPKPNVLPGPSKPAKADKPPRLSRRSSAKSTPAAPDPVKTDGDPS